MHTIHSSKKNIQNITDYISAKVSSFISGSKFKKRATFFAISIVVFTVFGLEVAYTSKVSAAQVGSNSYNINYELLPMNHK